MNESLETLIETCNKLQHKILEYKDVNNFNKLPRATVVDIESNEISFLKYEYGEWRFL